MNNEKDVISIVFNILKQWSEIVWYRIHNYWYKWNFEVLYQYFFWATTTDTQLKRYHELIEVKSYFETLLPELKSDIDIVYSEIENINTIMKQYKLSEDNKK